MKNFIKTLPYSILILVTTFSTIINSILISNEPLPLEWINKEIVTNDYFKKYAYISGAIKIPGVYEFKDGERLQDLIHKANGFTEKIDKTKLNETINLAEKLIDSNHYFIPFKTLLTVNPNNKENENFTDSDNKLIDINTATLDQLDSLPSIGESTAKLIMQNKPYKKISDLLNITGIGDKTFEKIKNLITVIE